MKLTPLIALLLCSCEVAPFVKENPDGSLTASMGGVFAARRKNTVAEITTRNGNHIKFMSEEESGEDVPVAGIQALGTYGAAKVLAHSTDLKTTTDGAATLKGTKDPNVIPKDPNIIPKDPNVIPLDPNP